MEKHNCQCCGKNITKEEYDLFSRLCARCENEITDVQEDRSNDYD